MSCYDTVYWVLIGLQCVGVLTDLVLSGSPPRLFQSRFFRAKVKDVERVPLAYDYPVALHGVTHGTMRLLQDESIKAGGFWLGLQWSSICVRVDN